MATALLPQYITVAEFDQMEFDDDKEFELLDGSLVEMSFATAEHAIVADQIAALLRGILGPEWPTIRELPYTIQPGTKRSADVGVIGRHKLAHARRTGSVDGPPELVVEVTSPSNRTKRDLRTALLCLKNGASQFWLVDTEERDVLVLSGDNVFAQYQTGSRIPLPAAIGGGELAVDDIFPAPEPPLS